MVSAVSSAPSSYPTLNEVTLFANRVICFTQAILNDVLKVYTGIFYKAISLIALLFSRDAYLYYRCKGRVCFLQSRHLEAYLTFGDRLIHSSINFKPLCAQYDRQVNLETIYGQANIQRWFHNHHLLEPHPDERIVACCAGISFDFLSKYLLALQNGSSSSEAIEFASSHREDGATIEAELAQIFMNRLFASINRDEISQREWIRIWTTRMSRLSPQEENLIDQMRNLPVERRREFAMLHFQELYDTHEMVARRAIRQTVYNHIATMFGYRCQIPPGFEEISNEPIYLLEKSIYLLTLPNKIEGEAPHMIVYIKTEENDFIFDSNFGTIKLNPNETADYFQEWYKDYYNLEGLDAIQVLLPAQLLSDELIHERTEAV